MFLDSWAKTATLGLALGAVAIAGCAGMTHSMDVKGEGQVGQHHDSMNHDADQGKPRGMEEEHHNEAHGDGHSTDDLSQTGHGHGGMHHGSLEIPEGQPVPQVTLTVEPDSMAGWNLQVETTNFAFAPERVNQESVATEGHAHLFINGEKITRLYGAWHYLPSLPAGEHELRVELNGNGHETLTAEGLPIEATVNIEVPAP